MIYGGAFRPQIVKVGALSVPTQEMLLKYCLDLSYIHNGIFGMNIYHVPIVPIFIMIFLVGLLQIVLSCVLSSNLKKETLVERIRYQG